MSQTIQEFIERLETQRGQSIDFSHELSMVTAKIVLRSLFNIEDSEQLEKMYDAIGGIQEHIMKHIKNPLFSPLMRLTKSHQVFKKEIKELDEWVYEIVDQRRASGEKKSDLLQMLLDVEDADTGQKMTNVQLRDELITIFATGHETTAIALGYAIYLLAKHKDVLQKVQLELQSILPKVGNPSMDDLKKLQYTNQVIWETLRLYAPTWMVGRLATKDDVVNGYPIKKGQNIILQLYILHRSPELWEQPNIFNPDRFAPELVQNRPKHHFMPFGTGPRMCIGQHFAMMEMQLMLIMLIARFDFNIVNGYELEVAPLITLRPKKGIRLEIN
jgi:cytochrome P450